jgi:dUTP pyrophosphatase
MLPIKIKKLDPNAVIPSYAKPGDAGLDLTAITMQIIDNPQYGYIEYGTGLAFEIPQGHVGLIFPRSSVSNTGLILSNSVGVIDSGYRGEVKFRYKYVKNTTHYVVGERVGQLIIIPYPQVQLIESQELSDTERNENGFGSSGK